MTFSVSNFNETIKGIVHPYEFNLDIPFMSLSKTQTSILARSFSLPVMMIEPNIISWGNNFEIKRPGKQTFSEWQCTFIVEKDFIILNFGIGALEKLSAATDRILLNKQNSGDVTITLGEQNTYNTILKNAWISSLDGLEMGHEAAGPLQLSVTFQYDKIDH